MEKMLNLILAKLDTVDSRLTGELNRQGALLHQLINTVAATNVKVTEINEKLSSLETKVANVETKVANVETKVANIETKVANIETKVANIETKVDTITLEVKEIKNSIVTKRDLEYYDLKISEHSRQIYNLKNQ
jgi:septal ring factor EnvC (AmiA/AmiB activator)